MRINNATPLGSTLRSPEDPRKAGGDGTGSKGSSAPFSRIILLLLLFLLEGVCVGDCSRFIISTKENPQGGNDRVFYRQ